METRNFKKEVDEAFNRIFAESNRMGKTGFVTDFIMNKVKFSNLSEKERTILFLILDEKFSPKELSDKLWPNQGEMRIKQIFLRSLRRLKINLEELLH